jgi:hypothetical protein
MEHRFFVGGLFVDGLGGFVSRDVEGFRGRNVEIADRGHAFQELFNVGRGLMEYFAMIALGVFLGLPERQARAVVGAVFKEQNFVDEPALFFQQGQNLAAPSFEEVVFFPGLECTVDE